MGIRRNARELALQMLYQMDCNRDETVPPSPFWQKEKIVPDARDFSAKLLRGVIQHRPEIDQVIRASAEHWSFERMAAVDRNILRLAVYELLHLPEIPHRVTLNEAIEIAKKYGSEDSGAFVNGVLDRIHQDISRSRVAPHEGTI